MRWRGAVFDRRLARLKQHERQNRHRGDREAQANEPERTDRLHCRRLRDKAAAPDGSCKQQKEVRLNARHFVLDAGSGRVWPSVSSCLSLGQGSRLSRGVMHESKNGWQRKRFHCPWNARKRLRLRRHAYAGGVLGSSLTRKLGLKEGRAALLIGVPDIAELRGFRPFLLCRDVLSLK